ncbi:hypothetical protein [Methylobacterium oryzihabitans]|uniref:Phosphate starvation-inducible protein PsiF n=1 Tax=Methylobacterium oryzihabitans TaxID=2499852 RepID=A0A3S2YT05_9HYPH|nr:hypothetical protein [Methylobacterium oryzihabitans]RVU18754.1 hypothetical protein EOE48_10245 [Methylobacterium oryzihabitans]
MTGKTSIAAFAACLILATGAGFAGAQAPKPAPAAKPAPSGQSADDAMTDVDPAVVAQCKSEADRKRLKGAPRTEFLRACADPED